LAELVDGVPSQREYVEEHRSWSTLEPLARGLRWIDESAESRKLFHLRRSV
jgi:hypothetical protein